MAARERRERIEQLFREHNEALIRLLSAQLHDRQEAKEVAQEAYVRMLALDHLDAVSYLTNFLFRTARNLAIDRLRQRNSRGKLDELVFFPEEATSPSPESTYMARRALERIARALDELPATCRKVFLLVRYEGLSYGEVAARIGVNERTVYRYVARALEHCHRVLEGDTGPTGMPR